MCHLSLLDPWNGLLHAWCQCGVHSSNCDTIPLPGVIGKTMAFQLISFLHELTKWQLLDFLKQQKYAKSFLDNKCIITSIFRFGKMKYLEIQDLFSSFFENFWLQKSHSQMKNVTYR